MPMFTNIEPDKEGKRHIFWFVNQQYDYLMCIYYDQVTQTYRLNCSDEEAMRIGKQTSGHDFDVKYWLKEAEQALREADEQPPKS